jgi:hypothetical protein
VFLNLLNACLLVCFDSFDWFVFVFFMFIVCSFGLQVLFIKTSFSTQTSRHASLQGEQQGDVIVLVGRAWQSLNEL